ncbi:Regulatory protein alcR [Diaporthe amygdali]|uniref:Regulatory protein alcR n=1 Tax=Phomopsis amygdali TaxID=1214568 RepID=UPI0022FEDB2E|nr:Regulatory protein alcR [Diaporthe amygdali]KAJ0119837.1 Regulatory protein alcR [Diaporthe amygdali]
MSRRQNSSCDQCRKGKRACDAVWLRDQRALDAASSVIKPPQAPGTPAISSHGDDQLDLLGPCTNCVRTNKQCTFEWVHSQQIQRKEKQQLASDVSTPSAKKLTAPAATPAPSSIPLRPLHPSTQILPFDGPYAHRPDSILAEDQLGLESCPYPGPSPDRFQPAATFRDDALAPPFLPLDMRDSSQHIQPHFIPESNQLTQYGLDSFSTGPTSQSNGLHSTSDALNTFGADVWSSPASLSVSSPPSSDDLNPTRKRRRTSTGRSLIPMPTSAPPWDLMSGNRLAATTNSFMIGETMMKIYHDVMEGALSCWLVEHTCPYKSLPSTPSSTSSDSQQQFGTFQNMQADWGPDWSNRVYRRVIKLDRMANSLGLKKLNPSEERKVSHALNSAVMAFTAQWAQSSQRSKARWSTADSLNLSHMFQPLEPDLEEEFDRTLQKSFWNQARRALDDCSEIDSFRVVFAEIIFGLTQKYAETSAEQQDPPRSGRNVDTSETVEEILREDSQQIWLERATRRLHVLRRRVELHDRNLQKKGDRGHGRCDDESKKTIDLLFWLAVMFDTISAAMTERPLTVSDEDSGSVGFSQSSSSVTGNVSKQWNIILSKDQHTKVAGLRFPLSDEVIAQELIDAAPVKVLLYRKVTRLQSLIAMDVDGDTIQDAIEDSLMVYRHWDHLYHPLFSDCIQHHLSLSARIQSWYVCLLGHWLLATLLMADLVESVDQRASRIEVGSWRRTKTREARHIRYVSVRMISDLAKASAPRHDDYGELVNFHHAVSEGALLTEPWTMILIRTFSRAAVTLLEGMGLSHVEDNVVSETSVDELRDNSERCQDCVKALWYLGRKSDMAREVANVLGVSLQRARMRVHI